jgi:hypothetical protein
MVAQHSSQLRECKLHNPFHKFNQFRGVIPKSKGITWQRKERRSSVISISLRLSKIIQIDYRAWARSGPICSITGAATRGAAIGKVSFESAPESFLALWCRHAENTYPKWHSDCLEVTAKKSSGIP